MERPARRLRRPLLPAAAFAAAGALAAPALAQPAAPDGPGRLGGASHLVIPQAKSFRLGPGAASAGVAIESVRAEVRIRERTATTSLEIALRNGGARQDEAVLLVPVPDGAVVGAFSWDGASSAAGAPVARVLPADEARRLYDSIVAELMDPALAEFVGSTLVRTSVFPVPAGGRQTVQLVYEHLLEADEGRVDYVLPRSESLDGRRPWAIDVDVTSAHPISTVYSPTHGLVQERLAPGHVRVRLDDASRLAPGAFRLSYLIDGGGVSASLFACPDEDAPGSGWFLLMAGLPAEGPPAAERAKREVTLVIDRSGSMAGAKMDQARAAALQIVEGLADGEAFNVIDYASTVSAFAPEPVIKDRAALLEARAYLASIRPAGGTNIHDALRRAVQQAPREGMLPIVLFLTDGLPTIGRTAEVDIRTMAAAENVHGRRIFTFGVGADVNAPLLDALADGSRARATYVMPGADVEVEIARVFRRLTGPLLADPELRTLDTSGAATTRVVHEVSPDPLPDLFDGDQLVVLGRYRTAQPVSFVLSGRWLGAPREFHYTFDLRKASPRHAFAARLWAGRRIALLVDAIRQAGATQTLPLAVTGSPPPADPRYRELVDEIARLSLRFGILTEYTAFLATEGADLGDAVAIVDGCSAHLDRRAVHTRSGAGAVSQALNNRWGKGQSVLNHVNAFVDDRLERVEIANVRQLCDRAFFRRSGRWIDSRLLPDRADQPPDEVVPGGTPRHVALLRRLATEGRAGVLSLRGEILLEVDGRVVLVKDGC